MNQPRFLCWLYVLGLATFFLYAGAAGADNVVQIENAKPGTTAWQLTSPIINREIEGYASLTSVNRGGQISFFVNTSEATYTLQVFRTGWYGGTGGRQMTNPISRAGVAQAMPQPDAVTGLIECNWTNPYVLNIPSTPSDPSDPAYWASGIYLVVLTAGTSGRQAYIIFVVRDDARPSDYLFQSSVNTYQAYNDWGGVDLYTVPQARKVSFNRPYNHNYGAGNYAVGSRDTFEQSMVRFLEREGYDVTYCSDVDTHENGGRISSHLGFLSVGHDEYWSWQMRSSVEAARDQGVSLAFFGGNACYWQIRFESSALTGAPDRTIVAYKQYAQTEDPVALDGDPTNDYLLTTQWRESPLSRPEDGLIGVMYETGGNEVDNDFVVEDPTHWIYSGAGVSAGDHLPRLIGDEEDRIFGHAPLNTARFAHSPFTRSAGNSYFADATEYRAASGATVVGIGSIQWSWGLDDWQVPTARSSRLNPAAQQMTHNVLARFIEGSSGNPGSAVVLSASASPQPVVLGGTLTFSLSVRNQGSGSLTNVVLTDSLPSGLTFQSVSSSVGTCGPVAGGVSCALGQLDAGGSVTISIVVSADRLGALKSRISVAADQPEGANSLGKLARVVGTGFSPLFGSEGAFVTIYGLNLGSTSAVRFNGINAAFVVRSNNQITTHVPAGAATGSLSVTTSAGTTTLGTFSVTPGVTGFSPPSGVAGTSVTITGTSFTGATAVTFWVTGATSFAVNSPNQITAVVPSGSATTGKISVTTPSGTGTSANSFNVTPVSVTGLNPTSGPAGSTITVTGANFTGASNVYLNDRSASFTLISSSQLSVVVPANATSGPISVTASGGSAYSASSFTITTPSISLFYPSAGPVGTSVSFDGGSFTGTTAVKFNGIAASYSVLSSARIVATVPPGATTGTITVTTPSGTATSTAYSFQPGAFTVTPAITSFNPTSGPVGTSVVITGTSLSGATSVTFNGTGATTFTVNSSTQITATAPSGATTGPIAVTTPAGTASSTSNFIVIAAPTITSFNPTSGPVGTSVTITGTNLSGATAVKFNGTSATTFSVNSSSQITTAVPSVATTGPIAVTTPGGTGTSASSFTVIPAPTITSFNPTSGPVGTSVAITGTNLSGATSVTFNGTSATTFTVNSSSQITAAVPSVATTGPIAVTTPGGTGTSASSFTVVPAPTITSFNPTSGGVGASVVITGTNLTGATAVTFNGTSATTFTVDSATQITATVPTGATTGPIAVTTPGGTGTSASAFTVGTAPTIASFNPSGGPAGAAVVITGANLTGATAVTFNGTGATSFAVDSSSQITATVPSGATTGPIVVTTPGGTATSASSFTVGPAPTISSLQLSAGAVGDVISIIGTDFNGVTHVTFSGIDAAFFTMNTPTQITATVPIGASTGRIGITASDGSGISPIDFTVTPFSPVMGPVGTAVTITGSNFTGATAVTFNGVAATSFTVNSDTQVTATVPAGASTGPIAVTTPSGTFTTTTAFTVTPFSPVIGPVGTAVTITGSGFTGATAVTFNGVNATSFTVDSDTQVTATVPAGATTGPIAVTTPSGTFTSTTAFTVTPFSPVIGPVGTAVTITGSSFTGATAVTFNGVNATSFTVDSDTQVTATVPAGATTGPIAVTSPGGTLTSASHFKVTSPAITAFSPAGGSFGSSVVITGANFKGATAVQFNGTSASFTVDAPIQITAVVPTGATTGPISVLTPTETATSVAGFNVTSSTITSFSPTTGPVGTSVVITGTNLTGATAVTFNGTGATTFTVNSATQITATVPSGATTGTIAVTTPGGTATSASSFTVIPAPTITNFNPTSGPVGTSVTITGTNLSGATSVGFNGVSATTFTVNSSTQITATVPSGATTGTIAVTTPGGTATSASAFTVILAPTITSFNPTSGGVGASVVITGTNLTGATAVTFNGTGATTFTVNSATQITAAVPSGATTGPIAATTPGGTTTSASNFTVIPAPTLTNFSPTSGSVGASVTITGTNLTGATAVKFNGVSATTFTVNSSTQITATVPSGATTGPIAVTTPGGTATSASNFTVIGSPSITSFSPTSGSVGTSVVITGTNLTGATAVKFNGVSATTFTVNSSTQITATVPSGATTGPIAVTTPGGTATSASSFTVIPPSTITSFSPTSGSVGASVTITGTNLTGATAVKFNGVSATTFTVNSSTQITATVPSGATTGPIAVTTPGGTATSASSFTVIPPPTITSFSPTSGSVGTSVVITGTNLTGATAVKFNGVSASFTVNSSTQITTTVPPNGKSGPLSVTTPGGTATGKPFQVK